MKKIGFFLALCTLIIKVEASGQSTDFQKHKQKISQTIYLTYGILAYSPEIIKLQKGEKVYIDERYVEKYSDEDLGAMLHIDSENEVYLPILLSDSLGYYTSIFWDFWSKAFHQRCNQCLYEWEAKWYESRCPNCGSTDFSNVPS